MSKGYDPKCGEIAEYFLPESAPAHQADLTQVVQEAVEDWFGRNMSSATTLYIRRPDVEGIAPLRRRDGSQPQNLRGTDGLGSTGTK
jgi:hypothetical protein